MVLKSENPPGFNVFFLETLYQHGSGITIENHDFSNIVLFCPILFTTFPRFLTDINPRKRVIRMLMRIPTDKFGNFFLPVELELIEVGRKRGKSSISALRGLLELMDLIDFGSSLTTLSDFIHHLPTVPDRYKPHKTSY